MLGRRLAVRYHPNGQIAARLGMSVAKRRGRLAVARSRARRAMRGAFLRARPNLPPMDIVVSVREDFTKTESPKLGGEFSAILARLVERESKAAAAEK